MNWQPPAFDKHQFAGRRSRAVSAIYRPDGWDTTGISFDNLKFMHVNRRESVQERRLDTPSWAVNNIELREVLLKFCERRFYLEAGRRAHVPGLSQEQRFARIRQIEQSNAKRWEHICREHRERYKTEPEERKAKLAIQLQNADTQVLLSRRGNMAMAAAVVYLYYRLNYDSVTVASTLRIKPPLVRQFLARLHNAASGQIYHSPNPKWQRLREFRAELQRVKKLWRAVKQTTEQHYRKQHREELNVIGDRVAGSRKAKRWTRDRLLFVHWHYLHGQSFDKIAPAVGCKTGESVRAAYWHFINKPQLLADFQQSV